MSKCSRCQTELMSGRLMGETHPVFFKPDHTPFFTFISNAVTVEAQMCPQCDLIEPRGDTDKLRLRGE